MERQPDPFKRAGVPLPFGMNESRLARVAVILFEPQDPVEAVVPMIPIVLPMVGAALIFLLAWIAVYMA